MDDEIKIFFSKSLRPSFGLTITVIATDNYLTFHVQIFQQVVKLVIRFKQFIKLRRMFYILFYKV